MSDTDTKTDTEKKKVSPEFVTNVKKYVQVDNELKEYRKLIKKLSEEKKNNEEYILDYLQTINVQEVGIEDGMLQRYTKKSFAPLKEEFIHKALTIAIGGDSNKAQMLTEHIIKSRPITEKVILKRIKNKEDSG